MVRLSKEDKKILFGEQHKTFPSYGILSMLSLFSAGALLFVGMQGLTKALSCIFYSETALLDTQIPTIFLIGGIILTITALALAGAAIATNRQSILGTFVLTIFILPLIYSIGVIALDLPFDLSIFSAGVSEVNTVNTDPNSLSNISSSPDQQCR